MSTIPNSPLTAAHLEQIRNALDVITIAQQQVELAKRAGVDVSAQETQLKDAQDKLLRLKNVYFPGV